MKRAFIGFVVIFLFSYCLSMSGISIERIGNDGYPVISDRENSATMIDRPADIEIRIVENNALLNRSAVGGATHYKLYTSIFPYGPYVLSAMIANNSFTYPNIDSYPMKFFLAVAYRLGEESDPSYICGSYRFDISVYMNSSASLIFENDMVWASELAEAIGIERGTVFTWLDNRWTQYVVGYPSTSFELVQGIAYWIQNGGPSDETWIHHGKLGAAHSFDIAQDTYTSIFVPMNRSDLTMASELADDIGAGVTRVHYMTEDGLTGYELSDSTDFNLTLGMGLLVYSEVAYDDWNAPERSGIISPFSMDRPDTLSIYQPFEDLTLERNCPSIELDLTSYFTGDQLSYTLDYNANDIALAINGDYLWINCLPNWTGQTEVSITANDGIDTCSDTFLITVDSTPINNQDIQLCDVRLHDAYPNPFNGETCISFSLQEPSDVEIAIYNVRGQHVTTLASGRYDAGVHRLKWNCHNSYGNPVASGVYMVRMEAADYSRIQKIMYLK